MKNMFGPVIELTHIAYENRNESDSVTGDNSVRVNLGVGVGVSVGEKNDEKYVEKNNEITTYLSHQESESDSMLGLESFSVSSTTVVHPLSLFSQHTQKNNLVFRTTIPLMSPEE